MTARWGCGKRAHPVSAARISVVGGGAGETMMFPSLTQLNREREVSGLPPFPSEQAVRDAFETACEKARRHEWERTGRIGAVDDGERARVNLAEFPDWRMS